MLNTMGACAHRGGNIIRQLLTFARGKPGARVPLPVRHLLDEMDKIVRETFPRNIRVKVDAQRNLWLALGDATQIHQALMNLCVNARDAMADGGTLTLAAGNTTLDETFVAATPEARPGPYLCLSVADTGAGIPPENLDRIFDPFFTTKEIGKGTGLGLPTVLGILRGHGGFVRVHSRVGSGTTFELFLPASPAAPAAPTTERATPPPRGADELILVADDEAIVRAVVQRTLEKHGYRVVSAAEGAEALALFTQRRAEIKAVLTDLMMPGMDGAALVQALRQLDADLPILGMTGLSERPSIKGLDNLNLPVVLTKPFAGIDLLAALQKTLTSRSPAGVPPADAPGAAQP
jgi:CheY-like chemotaxis protein